MIEGILVGRKFVEKKLYILYFKIVCKVKRGWYIVILILIKCINILIVDYVYCCFCFIFF